MMVIVCVAVVSAGISFARVSNTLLVTGHGQFDPFGPPVLISSSPNRNLEIFRGDSAFTPAQLTARMSALSELDGDLTAAITRECTRGETVVACPSSWRDWEMGTYTITYRVSDSMGREAEPIVIEIDIWQFIQIANGRRHGVALGSNGSVWTWGWNNNGQRGIGSSSSSAAGFRAPTRLPQSAFGNLPAMDIATGIDSSCALNVAGAAFCWGDNANGQIGDGTSPTDRLSPVPVLMPAGITFRQISGSDGGGTVAGAFGALGSDGNAYTWGNGNTFALGTGSTANQNRPTRITDTGNLVYVSQGRRGGVALTDDGRVMVWGANTHGNLALGNTTAANAATSRPTIVNGLPDNITQVSYGGHGVYGFVVVLTESGEVWAWGRAAGIRGTFTNQTTPIRLPNAPSNVRFIKAGADFTHMVVGNDVWGVGWNNFGETFSGNTSTQTTPFRSPLANIAGNVSMTAGGYDNAFILSVDGTTVWGVGFSDGPSQSFGSTVIQATSTGTAIPWTITSPRVEWQ